MRYFIFTILLVVPLLLTAQSKKEQIATLNLRVDSLSEVLLNERINNEKILSDKTKYILELSQETSDLEKEKVQLSQKMDSTLQRLSEISDSISQKNLITNDKIKRDVKSRVIKEYKPIESFGEIEKGLMTYWAEQHINLDGNTVETIRYNSDGGIDSKTNYDYDEVGNKVETIRYNSDGGIDSKTNYDYDEVGNKVKSISYNSDGVIKREITSDYDEVGNIVKRISINGSAINYSTYEYDKNGDNVSRISFNPDGSIKATYTKDYDEVGTLLEMISYNSYGYIDSKTTYEYDEVGNEVKSISYNSDGSVDRIKSHDYEYDNQMNMTRMVVFSNGEATYMREYEYEYYD